MRLHPHLAPSAAFICLPVWCVCVGGGAESVCGVCVGGLRVCVVCVWGAESVCGGGGAESVCGGGEAESVCGV